VPTRGWTIAHAERSYSMEQEQQRYERARERVKELKGFYTHVAIYVLVNIGLFIINLLAGGVWWFYWPLVGWGIGLLVHAINVFGFGGRLGRDWEERKTRELMDKER
jgi:uncharacterized membrane protein YdjX (TVP38/TMEM64 family)